MFTKISNMTLNVIAVGLVTVVLLWAGLLAYALLEGLIAAIF